MSILADRNCEACRPGTPALDTGEAAQLMRKISPDWSMEDGRIARDYTCDNFRDAFALATKVALLAEQQGHHPDLELGWGRLKIMLTTHAAKGLTDNDFIMAAKIDTL